MKYLGRSLYLILLFLAVSVSCKEKKVDPSTEDLLTDHPWNLESARVDNTVVSYYTGLVLSFTSVSYSTQNGGSLWESTGSWEWLDDSKETLLRDDGLEIHIETITPDQLILTFVWNSTVFESGRSSSVEGDHRMIFTD